MALALTLPYLRLNVDKEDDTIVSTVRLRIKLFNIAVIGVSSLLMVILVGYGFLIQFSEPKTV